MTAYLVAYLAGMVVLSLGGLALTAYAAFLRAHHPERYTGYWRQWGHAEPDPRRAATMAAISIGSAFLAAGVWWAFPALAPWLMLGLLGIAAAALARTLSRA